MTTAARPTFDPARGGATARDKNAPIRQISARDQAAHTKLKYRQPGQGGEAQDRDALRAELRRAEREAQNKARREKGLPELPAEDGDDGDDDEATAATREAGEFEGDGGAERRTHRPALPEKPGRHDAAGNVDADDSDDDSDAGGGDSDSDSGDDDDDDEDDTAALLAELEKIKRERAEEKARREKEKEAEISAEREQQIATGNPLLNVDGGPGPKDFSVKRRWDDDVIFKNQARGVDERPKKRFINDTLRSDFHRKFMAKYVQ